MTREKRLNMIKENMEMFGPLPNDFNEFVKSGAMKHCNYIFYDKKKGLGYCTGCHNEVKLLDKNIRHNKSTVCPCCGRIINAKSTGYSRENLIDVVWSVVVQAHGDNVLLRYLRHIKTYLDYKNPIITTNELFRSVVYENVKVKRFGMYDIGWRNYRNRMNSWYISEISEPVCGAYLYNIDIEKTIEDTPFKYSGLGKVIEHGTDNTKPDYLFVDKHIRLKNAYVIENYLDHYRNNKQDEQLVKCGLFNIMYDNNSLNYIIKGKDKVNETLGITKYEYKLIKELGDPECKALKIIKIAKEHKINLDIHKITSLYYDCKEFQYEDVMNLSKHMRLEKAVEMVKKYGNTYLDYISMAEMLGYDLNNSFVKFPKDVKKAHDLTLEEINAKKFKQMRIDLSKVIKAGTYNFEYKGLTIVVPKSSRDITKEAHAQHNCVASYIDRVAKCETMILFVRKDDCLNKSFYTLEYRDNRVVQCNGFRNCRMTDEVKEFVKEFEIAMNNREIQNVS